MEGRRSSTVSQLQILVQFAESNREWALGLFRNKEARVLSTQLWQECADKLNTKGPTRLPKEWSRVWNEMKCRVRSKLVNLNSQQNGTAVGSTATASIYLTPLEERVANLMGFNVGPCHKTEGPQTLTEENRSSSNKLQSGKGCGSTASVYLSPLELRIAKIIGLNVEPFQKAEDPLAQASPEENNRSSPNLKPKQLEFFGSDDEMNEPPPTQGVSAGTSQQSPKQSSEPSPKKKSPEPSPEQTPKESPKKSVLSEPRPSSDLASDAVPHLRGPYRRCRQPAKAQLAQNARERKIRQQIKRHVLESRVLMVRIEAMRARTEQKLAETMLVQAKSAQITAEAALMEAKANNLSAQSWNIVAHGLNSLAPMLSRYLALIVTRRQTQESSTEDEL